ncbi:MAG: DEAD/DEAH box helicase [Halobacteriaceae archaeon]
MEVAEVVPEFADAFAFDEFNEMQREVLPALLDGTENVVASAPTASGKTALAELAICRTLQDGGTALFVAPLRALTNEKESEWERFESLGYSVYVVTGERDLSPSRAERADVLVMTPEKVDSATRKHDSPRYAFIDDVDTVVVDEVHLLDSEKRGAVLEATISRLRRLCDPRIVALSATMPNVDDVAAWLDAPEATTFSFDDEYRPVDLHADVRTYSHGENDFADKYRRLYTALDIAEPHLREDGQALVFVASRQDAVRAAEKARDELVQRDVPMGARGDYDFHTETDALENQTLRQSVLDGVGFHHAGLSRDDKNRVEEWFKQGTVELLFATTTLAWGVNLPARCVVLRDTKFHDPLEGEVDMNPLDVLQMLGRAGRPGYDDVGYGWVVCSPDDADKYRRLLREGTDIESHLADDLEEHLNAEIAVGTIDDVADVHEWLDTTFYAVRAEAAPARYDFAGRRERVETVLDDLVDRGFVARDGDALEPTRLGRLVSQYYLRLDTAERFRSLADGDPDDDEILRAVARAAEFDSVTARSSERGAIDDAVDAHGLPDGTRKVLAVLRTGMDGTTPSELGSDAWAIRRNATRLLSAFSALLDAFDAPRAANRTRRLEARIEHGVDAAAVGLTAVEGVGSGRASKLASEGLTTPADVRAAGTAGLVDAGLTEGAAERVVEAATDLPDVSVEWGDFPDAVGAGESDFREVTVVNDGGGVNAAVRVTVNGVEMTTTETYLADRVTVPVGVFGADADSLDICVEVVFPEIPVCPASEERTVDVRG